VALFTAGVRRLEQRLVSRTEFEPHGQARREPAAPSTTTTTARAPGLDHRMPAQVAAT
jgi:hypothetical protein